MTTLRADTPDLHIEDPDLIGRRWRTGTLLLILADAAFVAALIFSYLYLRGLNTEGKWLAPHQHTAAIWVSWLIAAVLVVSAGLYHWGYHGVMSGHVTRLVAGAALALAAAVLAGVVQFLQLVTLPFGVADSAYSSCIYVIAGANLFHILITAFLGLAMWNRSRRGIYTADTNWQVHVVGLWWTWIAVSAVGVSLATSFIASPNHG